MNKLAWQQMPLATPPILPTLTTQAKTPVLGGSFPRREEWYLDSVNSPRRPIWAPVWTVCAKKSRHPPHLSKRPLLGLVFSPSLSTGAAARSNEGKPESTGDPSSAADADHKQHPSEGERAKEASSSRKRGGGSSAVAEAKRAEEDGSGDVRDSDEKGAGRGLASLGDLPSLGRKMVSPRAVSPLV